MPQQRLNVADVRPASEQLRGEGVAEPVWVDVVESSRLGGPLDILFDGVWRDVPAGAPWRPEDMPVRPLRGFARYAEEPLGLWVERDYSVLRALAANGQSPFRMIETLPLESRYL